MEQGDKKTAGALGELGKRIDAWRRTRGKPGRMPEALWLEAAKLAEREGLNRVAAPLRLDYYSLKSWMERGCSRRSATPNRPAFIEVRPAAAAPLGNVLELEKPGGLKMTLRLSTPLDVGAVVEAFWRCGA